MGKRIFKKLSSIVLIVVMLLSTVEPAIVAFANETSVTIDKGDYVFKYDITGQWDNHINASVTITNTGDKVIDNWSVKYNINGEIENIWNAVVYDKKDGEYIIKNATWNQDINVGESVSFGYTLYTENSEIPSDIQIICAESVVNNSEYEVNYNVSNSWGTGCVANVYINNVGSDVIEDWILEFDYENEITGISGGVIVENTDNHYIIKNPSYSQNIGVNGNAYIQIIANLGNVEAKLTNVVLRQVKTENIYEEQEESNEDYLSDEELLKEDYENLQIKVGVGDRYDDINGDVVFVEKGYNGSDIIWETSDETIINKSGIVNRDIEEKATVTCTAVLTLNGQSITKEFELTVKPKCNSYSKNMSDCNLDDLKRMNWNDENYYISVNQYGYIEQVHGRYSGVIVNSAETALYSLYNVRTALGISDPFEELELYDVDKDETGQIYKFRQMVNGVPCYDNNIVISCDDKGYTDYLMSDYFPVNCEVNVVPSISYEKIDAFILLEYPEAIIEDVIDDNNLFVFNHYGKCVLVWKKYVYMPEATYVMLINAETGSVVYKSECEYYAKDVNASGEDLLEEERTITVKQTTSLFGNKKYFLEDRTRNIQIYDADGSETWSALDEPDIINSKKINGQQNKSQQWGIWKRFMTFI